MNSINGDKIDMNTENNSFKLTYQQWEYIYSRLKENENIEQVYDYLIAKGERYARYAKSVLEGYDQIGSFTINYLASVANANGLAFNFRNYQYMYYNLAEQYLLLLEKKFTAAGKETIESNLTYQEIIQIHKNAFSYHQLPIDAWLFDNLFSVLPEEQRELFWQNTLNAIGDAEQEMEHSVEIVETMLNVIDTGTAENKAKAINFFQRLVEIKAEMDSGSIDVQPLQTFFSHPNMEDFLIRINEVLSINEDGANSNSLLQGLNFDDSPSALERNIIEFEKNSGYQNDTDLVSEVDAVLVEQITRFDICPAVFNSSLLSQDDMKISSIDYFIFN